MAAAGQPAEDLEYYGGRAAILRLLQGLWAARRPLAFDLCQRRVPTRLLQVDPDAGLLLERAPRREDEDTLFSGAALTLVGGATGETLWFQVPGLVLHAEGGDYYYRTPLPAAVYRQQRRRFFRVRVPAAVPSGLTVNLGEHLFHGRVTDLSLGGLCAELPAEAEAHFRPQAPCPASSLQVDQVSLVCDLLQCVLRPGGRGRVRLGLRYAAPLAPAEEQALGRLLMRLQARQVRAP